jgi:hypothetical protein
MDGEYARYYSVDGYKFALSHYTRKPPFHNAYLSLLRCYCRVLVPGGFLWPCWPRGEIRSLSRQNRLAANKYVNIRPPKVIISPGGTVRIGRSVVLFTLCLKSVHNTA